MNFGNREVKELVSDATAKRTASSPGWAAFGAMLLLCPVSAWTQQASITMSCNGGLCYTNNTEWTLTKEKAIGQADPVTPPATVTFTVKATRGLTTANLITAVGYVTVTNSGSAPASIGNIVVNLQKQRTGGGGNPGWVSAAADCANATNGDAATTCKVVAGGTQESASLNSAQGGPAGGPPIQNYATTGTQGTFIETPGSGTLNFTDATNNTVFSLVPQPVIPVGASVTLKYEAQFNNTILKIPAGASLRTEVLVSFGNAGARGGGGATASSIDINGNNALDSEEANVRTVPCRTTSALPALENSNDSVTLSDKLSDITQIGGASYSNFTTTIGGGSGAEVINATATRIATVDVTSLTDTTGKITNTVHLDGQSTVVRVDGPINPVTGLPDVVYTFPCCVGVDLDAAASVDLNAPPLSLTDGDFCTFSQGGFGGQGAPFNRLSGNFATIYPSGVEVGIPGASGFSMAFTSATAVQSYLPAGGAANKLTADSTNPTSTTSGQFGGQTLALKLNLALSNAGVNPAGFGNLYYCPAPGDSLRGQTVAQILAAAETAMGGGALPSGYTYSGLSGLAANLDLSFDGSNTQFPTCGVASAWAIANLSKTACH